MRPCKRNTVKRSQGRASLRKSLKTLVKIKKKRNKPLVESDQGILGLWYVYMIKTQNNQLYTGITNNIDRRMKAHQSGRGARFTRIFGFKKLVYIELVGSRSDAMKKEALIKTWSRRKKDQLIKPNLGRY